MLRRQCLVKQLRWDSLSLTKKGHGHTRGAELIGYLVRITSLPTGSEIDLELAWPEKSCKCFPWFSGLGGKVLFLDGLTCAVELNLSTAVLVNLSTTSAKLWVESSFRDPLPALFKCFLATGGLVPWHRCAGSSRGKSPGSTLDNHEETS
ncbi:hypothetical protein F5883DRAFT_579657 [Diaporthe sp. PMI_573]|nr:hypothetical protein F5883DRAFT_579657 [Diaporthaceae sp. PMI_573]